MNPNNRLSLAYGLALSTLLPLAFSGCQTVEPGPEASSSQSEYTAGILKLKASGAPDYDQELSKLNSRFSVTTPAASSTNPVAPAPGGVQAAAKIAGTLNFSTSFRSKNIQKYVFRATAGAVVTIRAQVANIGAVNPADPMIFLIQFNDPSFITQGKTNNYGQHGFRIVAMDDDGGGNADSYLTHTFAASEVGYYMWLVLPYANGNSTGKVNLNFLLTNPGCPPCQADYIFHNPITLGGAVFRSVAGNDFQSLLYSGQGDPHVYVFRTTAWSGMANGDEVPGNVNSRVFALPFGISPWESNNAYNMVLVDNDNAGTNLEGFFRVYNQ